MKNNQTCYPQFIEDMILKIIYAYYLDSLSTEDIMIKINLTNQSTFSMMDIDEIIDHLNSLFV